MSNAIESSESTITRFAICFTQMQNSPSTPAKDNETWKLHIFIIEYKMEYIFYNVLHLAIYSKLIDGKLIDLYYFFFSCVRFSFASLFALHLDNQRLPVVSECPAGQTARVTSNIHSSPNSSGTMAVSRVPSPPLPEVNTPVAENWCYTQVRETPIHRFRFCLVYFSSFFALIHCFLSCARLFMFFLIYIFFCRSHFTLLAS